MLSRIYSILLILLLAPAAVFAQAPKTKEPVLVTFSNGQKITRADFEFVYAKNNGGLESAKGQTPAQYRDYLNLYIDFRRKVMEAERLGLDTTGAFVTELEGYLKQIAAPYMIEKKFMNNLIEEAYLRSQTDVRGYRLVIGLPAEASAEDTLKAYKLAKAIRDSVLNKSKTFEQMVVAHSTHPQAKIYKGDIGWNGVFDLEYLVENALYNTPVGQLTQPIRIRSGNYPGYYLFFVGEKMPSPGKKRASHIVVRWGPTYTAKDSVMAQARINEVYSKLKAGTDFSALATEYSDDPQSRNRGGDLNNIRLIPPMEDVKQKLGAGEYSQPFRTPFGWHILRVTEVTPIKMGDQARNETRQRVLREPRAKLAEDLFLANLRAELNYTLNSENKAKFLKAVGERYRIQPISADSFPAAVRGLELFRFGGKSFTAAQLGAYLGTQRRSINGTTEAIFDRELDEFAEQQMLDYEEKRLPEKYPDYRRTMREYRDGILLFTLTEKMVWRKAVEDTAGLRKFFQANLDSFPAKDRAKVREFSSFDTTALLDLRKQLRDGLNLTQIDSFLKRTRLQVRSYERTFEKGSSAIAQLAYTQPKGFVSTIQREGTRYFFYILLDFLPAGNKTFEEARPEAITKYQNYLEKKWLQDLRARYPVKSEDKKVFQLLFKS